MLLSARVVGRHVQSEWGNVSMTLGSTMRSTKGGVAGLIALVLVAVGAIASPASAATTVLAKDSFSRTAQAGWAGADVGGNWTSPNSQPPLSVSNGKGRMDLRPGSTSVAELSMPRSATRDVVVDVAADRAATGGGQYFSVVGRGDSSTGYRLIARVRPTGAVEVSLRRTVGGSVTVLAATTIKGLVSSGASPQLRMRMSVGGSGPTRLQAKVWRAGQAEPSTWALSAEDASTAVPASGGLGLLAYLSSGATNAPVQFQFDNFEVTTPAMASVATPSVSKPDAASTGVPDGVSLKVLSPANRPYAKDTIYSDGSALVINTPNAVYDGWQFDMFVEVRAPGVKITRSLFRGAAKTTYSRGLLLIDGDAADSRPSSAVVEDSTLIPRAASNLLDGVRGSNVTLRRVEIAETGRVTVYGSKARTDPYAGNVAIEGSWIHDLRHYNDSSHADGTHNDGVQVIGGRNIRITGSRIDGTIHNAGIMITNGRNNVANVAVTNSWLASGACTINVSDKSASAITGLSIVGNTFTRGSTRISDCAMIVTDATRTIATASHNAWHNGSTPAPAMGNGG